MANIYELDYGDYVRVNNHTYWVFGVDYMSQSAGLIDLDILDCYTGDDSLLSDAEVIFPARQIVKLPPVKVDKAVLRSLFRLEVTPWELAKQGRYPFEPASGKFKITEEDVLVFARNLSTSANDVLIDAWQKNYSRDAVYRYASFPRKKEPGFDLAFLCERILDVMDWFDLTAAKQLVGTLAENYLESKGKPLKEMIISDDFKGHILDDIEDYADDHAVTEEMREYYAKALEELYAQNDPDEWKRKAYAYYGGNGVVPCDWKKSEEALLKVFEWEGDPYAANSLGYIYYSDRLGAPDYEKAFFFFDYAAGRRVVEATYKLSDMCRKGHGTVKNPERAWGLLVQLYDRCNKKKKAEGKYPDIMLRMGYCHRDGVGVERDIEKARECFYEAKEGIELRLRKYKGFGDEVVYRNVMKAIEGLEC